MPIIATDTPLRVAIVHSWYRSNHVSGENRAVAGDITLLREAGHHVLPIIESVRPDRSRVRLGLEAVWSPRQQRVISTKLEAFRPDIVHYHSLYPAISPAGLRHDFPNVPIVMTLHNYRLMCLPATLFRDGAICEECVGRSSVRGIVHACYRNSRLASMSLASSLTLHTVARTFDRVTRFVAVSEFVKQMHVAAGFAAHRISVRAHHVPQRAQRVGPGDGYVIASRLSPEKGLHRLVHSWPGDIPLVICGDGPLRSELQAGAPNSVRFLGSVSPAAVASEISRARAVLVPSECYETAGLVVLEAFASGVPVVATRIGGLSEVVDHDRNGLLVEPRDLDGWFAAIMRLQDDGETRRLGTGAKATWHQRFSPEVGLRTLLAAYTELLHRPH